MEFYKVLLWKKISEIFFLMNYKLWKASIYPLEYIRSWAQSIFLHRTRRWNQQYTVKKYRTWHRIIRVNNLRRTRGFEET